jgi:hypothetical protein
VAANFTNRPRSRLNRCGSETPRHGSGAVSGLPFNRLQQTCFENQSATDAPDGDSLEQKPSTGLC